MNAVEKRPVSFPILVICWIEDRKVSERRHIAHSTSLWRVLLPEIRPLIEKETRD